MIIGREAGTSFVDKDLVFILRTSGYGRNKFEKKIKQKMLTRGSRGMWHVACDEIDKRIE